MSKDPLSKIRAGDVYKQLMRVLSEYRIQREHWDIVDKRPHPVLTVRYEGIERSMSFPGTPSGRGSAAKYAGVLRRLLKTMQMESLSPPKAAGAVPTNGAAPDYAPETVKPLTMSSREIADLTGSTHDNVLKTIRRLVGEGVVLGNETTYRHHQNGQLYPEYRLDYRNTMVVVSGYSAELRARIIDRWLELEAQQKAMDAVRLAVLPADWDRLVGMTKMLAHKLTETEKQVVQIASRINSRDMVAAYDMAGTVTSLMIIEMAGVPSKERVRGTSAIVTRNMKNFCLVHGYRAAPAPSHIDPDARWRFPREAAMEWLVGDQRGSEIIRSHVAKERARLAKKGQMALQLVECRP